MPHEGGAHGVKPVERSLRTWGVPAALGLLGMAIAAYHCGSRSIWHDEAATWRLLQFPWSELISRSAGHVIGVVYVVLLKLWTGVFGESLVALRSMSILFHGVTVVAFYFFLLELLRPSPLPNGVPARAVATLASFFVAVSALQTFWAGQAKPYPLTTAMVALSSWALVRAARRERARDWTLYAVLAVLTFYCHSVTMFTLVAQFAWLALRKLIKLQARGEEPLGAMGMAARKGWLLAGAGVAAGLGVWVPTLLLERQRATQGTWMMPLNLRNFLEQAPSFVAGDAYIVHDEAWVSAATLAVFCWALLRTWRLGVVLPVIGAVIPTAAIIASSLTGPNITMGRYLLFSTLFMWAPLAIALLSLEWARVRRGLVVACVAVVALYTVRSTRTYDLQGRDGPRELARRLAQTTDEKTPIIISAWLYLAVLYHLDTPRDVRIYSRADIGIPLYMSGAILSPADRLTSLHELERDSLASAVLVHSPVGDPVELPARWKPLERVTLESPWSPSELVRFEVPARSSSAAQRP